MNLGRQKPVPIVSGCVQISQVQHITTNATNNKQRCCRSSFFNFTVFIWIGSWNKGKILKYCRWVSLFHWITLKTVVNQFPTIPSNTQHFSSLSLPLHVSVCLQAIIIASSYTQKKLKGSLIWSQCNRRKTPPAANVSEKCWNPCYLPRSL
jgi:hypothetical protein